MITIEQLETLVSSQVIIYIDRYLDISQLVDPITFVSTQIKFE